METIIQLHTTTSRCIIIQQIFGKTIPNFGNPKYPAFLPPSKVLSVIIATWWLMFTESFNCRISWVASKNPFRNGATHTHHTRQTLAQGRLEERHDKAGSTPENAEPSLLLYDPFFVYPGVPLRAEFVRNFSNMPVKLVTFTTSSAWWE